MARHLLKACAVIWMFAFVVAAAAGGTVAGAKDAAAQTADSAYGIYVQDEAGILSGPTKDELYDRAVWLHDQTGTAQIGVVTVSSLEGESLEALAVARFREMGLGDKSRNDGVLLLFAAAEGRVRIEVGYGLEGRIPDGKAGAILDAYFVPNRDSGQLDAAFSQTQAALIQEVAAEYGVDVDGVPGGSNIGVQPEEDGGLFAGIPGFVKVLLGIGVVILIFLDFKFTGGAVTYAVINLLGRRGSGGGGGGRWGGRGGGGSSGGGGASR